MSANSPITVTTNTKDAIKQSKHDPTATKSSNHSLPISYRLSTYRWAIAISDLLQFILVLPDWIRVEYLGYFGRV